MCYDEVGGEAMSVTIKDIAKLANVSHTTVSRALNDSPLIQEETKRRIKAMAEELGYIPNFNAKSLVLDRSYNVGLFFSTLNTGTSAGFFHDAVRGVNEVIKSGYNLVVKGIDDYNSGGGSDFLSVTKRSFDGIIIVSQTAEDDPFIEHVRSKEIPLVILNRFLEDNRLINIVSDEEQGAYHIVEYLALQGHRRIAMIEGKEGFRSTQVRKQGYLKALERHGIAVTPDLTVRGRYTLESGYKAMKLLLRLPELPTAVFCSNDEMAVGAIRAIREHGLRVPEDISIAGFDDNVYAAFISPALTTVRRPIAQISKEGAIRLLQSIDRKEYRPETVYLKTELVVRDSVTAPKVQS
jgi:LacI family transcriptional regulator